MLQIIIIHGPDDSVCISEVKDLETMTSLATYDESKNCIDLSCLEPHINETILVTHFKRHSTREDCTINYNYTNCGCAKLDYEQERTLIDVGTDENGFMYLEYN